MSPDHLDQRPAAVSSALAVALGAAIVFVLAGPGRPVARWLAIELGGIGAVAVGSLGYRRGYRLPGAALGVVGAGLFLAAIGGFATRPLPLSRVVRLVPGLLGLGILGATLVPIRGDGSRALVKAGAAGLFACVLLAGLFETAGLELLLATTVGTVLVWDAGDNAIGIGQQLGRDAETWRLEATHLTGTALVGVAGTGIVLFADTIGGGGLSFPAFAMVFVALVLLTLALRW